MIRIRHKIKSVNLVLKNKHIDITNKINRKIINIDIKKITNKKKALILIEYLNGKYHKSKINGKCKLYITKKVIKFKLNQELINKKNNQMKDKNHQIKLNEEINIYLSMLDEFNAIYSTSVVDVLNNPKIEFRYYCYRYLKYIRNINVKNITYPTKYETCLVEFRNFPHIEFLIRNTINKLPNDWCHTIICGTKNYQFIKTMCGQISKNINIIQMPYDNITVDEYNNLLLSLNFWNLLVGEKILIYQEDSCIFKNNINDFIQYDFIGASWPETPYINKNNIGNGGLSLRTRQCMIDIINNISPKDTQSSNFQNLSQIPEDVYFTINMYNSNKYNMPNRDISSKFSIESIYIDNSFGGHNFWVSYKNWKNLLYKNIVIQYKPTYDSYINSVSHRGGWKSIINILEGNDFFNYNSNKYFYDTIDILYLHDNYELDSDCAWNGIIHWTPSMPKHLQNIDINNMFIHNNFIKKLKTCEFLITLSHYLSNYVKNQLNKYGINIPVYVLKHPVEFNDSIPIFTMEKFIQNPNKKLIQLGQQARKLSSIYLINTTFEKMWLTGTSDCAGSLNSLDNECKEFNIDINKKDVKVHYTKTYEEYDQLLSENIILVDLFNASANNSVLECIVRNTPLIVKKLDPIVEYLGENYPLYFNELSEVNSLLTNDKFTAATNYMYSMKKDDLTISYFINKLFNLH